MSATNVEYDLTRLEIELKQLETEYTMYFAGRVTKPPWDTRARVDAAVKKLDRAHIKNTAARFRFSTIQSRYAAFVELWERNLRAKEEGAGQARWQAPLSHAQPEVTRTRVGPIAWSTLRSFTMRKTKRPWTRSMNRWQRLGATLVRLKCPFEKFTNVVTSEVERLRAAGSRDVTLRVTIKDGKAHLTARSGKVASTAQKPAGDEEKRKMEKEKAR